MSPVAYDAMLRPLMAGLPKLELYPESRGQDSGFTWDLWTSATGCSPGTRSGTAAGPAASSGSRCRAASASRC